MLNSKLLRFKLQIKILNFQYINDDFYVRSSDLQFLVFTKLTNNSLRVKSYKWRSQIHGEK